MIVIANAGELTDPDLWGHLRFGQAVLATHHLLRNDPYSYTAIGLPWRNHEWLTELWMALVYNGFGVIGLKLWKFGCVAATILFSAAALAETGASAAIQLNLLIVAAVAVMPQMQFRPQLFTFALFAAMLWLLARYIYRGASRLWPVIPLMALWANLHGGFIAGLGALGVFSATLSVQDLWAGRGLRRAIGLTLLTIGATLATLLTPYGIETWFAVAHALRDPMTRVAINDWQPLLFHVARQLRQYPPAVIYYLCAMVLMGTLAASFLLAPATDDLPLVMIGALMTFATFTAVRNMPLAAIACIIPAARHLSLVTRERAGASKTNPGPVRSEIRQRYIAVAAGALALYSGVVSPKLATDGPYPAGAVHFLQSRGLKGNILADFGWGEYLIWHAPESKVFIDGRYDTVFPYQVIDDYLALYFAQSDASKLLRAYPHDFILMPPKAPLDSLVLKSSDWTVIYRDSASILFARSSLKLRSAAESDIQLVSKPQYFP